MLVKLTEFVAGLQQAIHITKPLLFELVLFVWAVVEMGKFIWAVAFGQGA